MTGESTSGSFPFEEYDDVFADVTRDDVENVLFHIELEEDMRQRREVVMDALANITDEPLLHQRDLLSIEYSDMIRFTDFMRLIFPFESFTHELIDEMMGARYHIEQLVTTMDEQFLADVEHKVELQVDIIRDQQLSNETRRALLEVVNILLLPGKGINFNDPDEILEAISRAEAIEQQEVIERLTREEIVRIVSEQSDFMKAHHIHPNDPAWKSLMIRTSRYFTNDNLYTKIIYVQELLDDLHLTQDDFEELLQRIRDIR